MRYFILAGEKSGDQHGANVLRHLNGLDPEAEVFAWGGSALEAEGAKILKSYQSLAFMGVLDVLLHLGRLRRAFKELKQQWESIQPEAVIFIDYGGFNLRAAKMAKGMGIPTHFYIAPKVWAWNYGRIHKIKAYIDVLYVIFPFEVPLFQAQGIKTHYVGNPVLDAVASTQENGQLPCQGEYIALLPGSRKQEIKAAMPLFKALQAACPEYTYWVMGVEEHQALLERFGLKVRYEKNFDFLKQARMAIVTSGTASLETALLGVPQVVVYRTDPIFYRLASWVIRIPYIALPNIIAEKALVPELIQEKFSVINMKACIQDLYPLESTQRKEQLQDLETLKLKMGPKGAGAWTAEALFKEIKLQKGNL